MTLADLAALGSFVSGIAVLVSLVFLYFQLRQVNQQVRQTERNQQAMMRQARSSRSFDMGLKGVESDVAEVFVTLGKGGDAISEKVLLQWMSYTRSAFINWDDAFSQHKDGLLSGSALESLERTVGQVMRGVTWRTEWRLQRETFAPEFVAWMDKLVADHPRLEPVDRVASWRSAFEAEQSGGAAV
jgi:hypothetical protein